MQTGLERVKRIATRQDWKVFTRNRLFCSLFLTTSICLIAFQWVMWFTKTSSVFNYANLIGDALSPVFTYFLLCGIFMAGKANNRIVLLLLFLTASILTLSMEFQTFESRISNLTAIVQEQEHEFGRLLIAAVYLSALNLLTFGSFLAVLGIYELTKAAKKYVCMLYFVVDGVLSAYVLLTAFHSFRTVV